MLPRLPDDLRDTAQEWLRKGALRGELVRNGFAGDKGWRITPADLDAFLATWGGADVPDARLYSSDDPALPPLPSPADSFDAMMPPLVRRRMIELRRTKGL
jgi:hypothetical protein